MTFNTLQYVGSEQRIDYMYHSAERRKESALINSSLLALKDCIRARADGKKDYDHFYKKVLAAYCVLISVTNTRY